MSADRRVRDRRADSRRAPASPTENPSGAPGAAAPLPARDVRCEACHGGESVRTQDDLGENGLCETCRERSRTAVVDEELGGEC